MPVRIQLQLGLAILLLSICSRMTCAEVFIDQSHDAQSLLAELNQQVQSGQWNQATYLADELLTKYVDDLVAIQPYRYVPVVKVLQNMAGRSTDLRQLLRARDAAQAMAELDAADSDPILLEQVACRYGWTEAGRRAGLHAAGLYLERAEFSRAVQVLDVVIKVPGSEDDATQAHELAATAAVYTGDMAALRERVLRLRDRSAVDELASLKRLAQSVKRPVDPKPRSHVGLRLTFDEPSGKKTQREVLRCLTDSHGTVRWAVRPRELNPPWRNAHWAGRPMLVGDRAYIPVKVIGAANLTQVIVASLNVHDGSLVWARRIYSRSVQRRSKLDETGLCDLTEHDGAIYACVDGAALCRLSPRLGRVQWITLRPAETAEPADQAISPWIRQRIAAVEAGLVMIQPGQKIMVFDPQDGQVIRRLDADLWRHPQHLRVMGDGVMAFGDRIVRIDGRTLEPTWISPEPFDPRSFDDKPDSHQDIGPRRTRSLRDSVGGRIHSSPLDTRIPDRRVR